MTDHAVVIAGGLLSRTIEVLDQRGIAERFLDAPTRSACSTAMGTESAHGQPIANA